MILEAGGSVVLEPLQCKLPNRKHSDEQMSSHGPLPIWFYLAAAYSNIPLSCLKLFEVECVYGHTKDSVDSNML